jgi:ABC-type proline/glycine betaine transport system ATPase subunit
MSKTVEQNFKNHARTDPPFHYVLLGILFGNLFVWIGYTIHQHSLMGAWQIALAIGLILLAFKTRIYALKVQDRVIRLEERLRLATLLPEPLRPRIPELSEGQLVALRFAPDAEVLLIVETALKEKLTPKQIKELIQNWRPDYWRV